MFAGASYGPRCGQSEDVRVGGSKEILGELFDIRTREVYEMIRQRMEERTLYGQEFNLLLPGLSP